jgi:hypothetical protein
MVHRRAKVTTRALAALALAAVAAAVSGCSPGADYPSLFPAVHDMPPPRGETTLDPAQVQQATEDLISARDHLNAEAPAASQDKTPDKAAKTGAKDGAKSGAKTGDKTKPATTSSGNNAAGRTTQTAGAETKP